MRITRISLHVHPSVRDWALQESLDHFGLFDFEQLSWLPVSGNPGLLQARWSTKNLTVLLTRLDAKTDLDSVSCTANNEAGEAELLSLLTNLASENYHPLARKSIHVYTYRSNGQTFSQSNLLTRQQAISLDDFTWYEGKLCFLASENHVTAPRDFPISWAQFKLAATSSAFWANRPVIDGIAYMIDSGTHLTTLATELLNFELGGLWQFGQYDRIPVPNMAGDGFIDEIIGEHNIMQAGAVESFYYRSEIETLTRIKQYYVWECPKWLLHLKTLRVDAQKGNRLIIEQPSPAGDHMLSILAAVDEMLQHTQ